MKQGKRCYDLNRRSVGRCAGRLSAIRPIFQAAC